MTPFIYKYQTVNQDGKYVWMQKLFDTQKELFRYLVEERELIFSQKKSITKRAEGGLSMIVNAEEIAREVTNKLKPLYENDKEAGLLKRTILANTYWWMDHHSDVHLGRGDDPEGTAIFSESIKNRASKVPPIDQHNWSLDGRMGKTLALYEAPISWRSLGIGNTGMTEGLFADAEISKKKSPNRYEDYLNDEIDQHSVAMNYVDIQLAVNDEDEYPKEYAVFQKYIKRVGNRKEVEKQGYFFAVAKAKLGEYSAVIAGSNELTPTMGVSQSSGDTGKREPSGDIRKKAQALVVVNSLNNLHIQAQKVKQ